MATPQPKSLITILGALAVAAVGAYLGLDRIGGGSTTAPGTSAVKAKASTVISTTSSATPDRADTCLVRELPVEVEDTIADISDGAPYAHGEFDNRHFGNYERVLPKEKSSYYREFTVDTPGGEPPRGASHRCWWGHRHRPGGVVLHRRPLRKFLFHPRRGGVLGQKGREVSGLLRQAFESRFC